MVLMVSDHRPGDGTHTRYSGANANLTPHVSG